MSKENILLKEYETCQHDNGATAQSYWTLTSIFIGFSSVLLGVLIYVIFSNNELFKAILNIVTQQAEVTHIELKQVYTTGLIIFLVSATAIIILCSLKGWLRRVRFTQQCNLRRMREIELILKIRKSMIVQGIDHWKDLERELNENVKDIMGRESLKKELINFYRKWNDKIKQVYELPSGEWHHKWIFGTLFLIWFSLLGGGGYLLYCHTYFHKYLAISIVVVGVFVVVLSIILIWGKCKKCKVIKRLRSLYKE